MSLKFILGGSGYGKSRALYEEFIEQSIKEPSRSFFLLVPDQFTMQTQKELVSIHPARGILNLDVLSFGRLTHRAFEEAGAERPLLDDTGKNLVLRHLIGERIEELPLLGKKLSGEGFIHEIKSVLSEFMQYAIAPADLDGMIRAAEGRGELAEKLTELKRIYAAFREWMGERYLTAEASLELVLKLLPGLRFLRGSVLAFDGFTGFTPIQLKVIEGLMQVCARVVVVLTMDEEAAGNGPIREEELFALSRTTRDRLEELAFIRGIPREEDLILKIPHRFAHQPGLAALEKNLFRKKKDASLSAPSGGIFLSVSTTPAKELQEVCLQIRELLRQGFQYRDIAVILGDVEPYRDWIEIWMNAFGIPFFLDETKGLRMNPMTELLEGALEVLEGGFRREDIVRFIRSGISDFTPEEADFLERYLEAYGLRGEKAFRESFVFGKRLGLGTKELETLNALRQRLIDALSPLTAGAKTKTAEEWAKALYALLVRHRAGEKLAAYAERFERENRPEQALEFEQVYRTGIELLDQIYGLLGPERLTAAEMLEILSSGISEIRIGRIPQNVDRVLIGDMERTRLGGGLKALFFLGLNDGNVPRSGGAGGLLSALDRAFIEEAGYTLAPSGEELQFTQRLYLYLTMTRPSERLYLSFYRMDGEGKAVRPSYLTAEIRRLFPGISLRKPEEEAPACRVETPKGGEELLAEAMREEKNPALRYAYAQASPGLYARLLEAACIGYEERPLKCAPLLFGKALHTTVSRLEAYAGCAYQHFLHYGLKLAERPAAGVMAFDTGNVLHEAIRLFGEKAAQEGTNLAGFSDELLERCAPEAVKDAAAVYGEQLFGADARSFYLLRQYAGILKSSLRAIRYQLKEGSFLPRAFELPVDGEKKGIFLPSGGRLFFHGRIDRADIAEGAEEAWLKILDYKTGEKTFKPEAVLRGTQLQLPLYMAAALRRLQNDITLPLAPGGMLYQQLKDPVLEEGKEAEREKEYRPSGLISAKPEILRAFDRGLGAGGNSAVIPVGINKDGSFRASSGAVSPEEFGAVLFAAEKKAAALADRILQGDISLSPLEEEGKLHCAYCPYRHVCGFDLKLQGCAIRREEMTPEEALLRMRPPAEKAGEDRGKK